MAKVITSVLRFPEDQTLKILEREDARPLRARRRPNAYKALSLALAHQAFARICRTPRDGTPGLSATPRPAAVYGSKRRKKTGGGSRPPAGRGGGSPLPADAPSAPRRAPRERTGGVHLPLGGAQDSPAAPPRWCRGWRRRIPRLRLRPLRVSSSLLTAERRLSRRRAPPALLPVRRRLLPRGRREGGRSLRSVPSESRLPVRNRRKTYLFPDGNREDTLTPEEEVRCLFPGLQYVCLPKSSAKVIICFEFLQLSATQSLAQRLQLRVPSMESLFRSPVKESLFRSSSKESLFCSSSKESLLGAASKDSLSQLDLDTAGPNLDPRSDTDSETEEPVGNADSLSKEQMLQRRCSCWGKCSELVSAYQVIQREKQQLQDILSQTQGKALRRIGELREELQMTQQARKHLQEEFDASLEEKDQLISVLQTQVSLLKKTLQNGQIRTELPDSTVPSKPQVQSPTKEVGTETPVEPGSNAFEELERALSLAQKAEEAQKKLQAETDKKIKAVEKASEEERVNLQRELTRVKQEVVEIMKKSSEERVAELEKCHKKEMAAKDRELNERLQAQEKAFQGKMKAALEINRIEYLKALQEQEEQGSLALEELELQKKAIQSQCDKKVQRMHQEVKTSRTRILELESSLAKYLEEARKQSEEKKQHNKEISDIVEKHKNELENMKQQQEKLWTEKLQILKQQQVTEMEKMREKQEQEIATILKEKETVFRAHIEEMNEKTLQKLDVKQAEFEALSSELSEALKIRHALEQELSALNSKVCEARQELEEERKRHKEEVEVMSKEHAMSIRGVEEVLKEELNQLRQSLKKLAEQEAKLKKELENKQLEFSQKESEFNAKMLEMAHAGTAGINDAVSKLECNHKEQLESLAEAHRRELVEITRSWEEKLHQQVEELQEKHEMELQEKEQEVGDLKEELATCSAEKEGSRAEITRLKGEQVTREESLKELQEQLRQSVSKIHVLEDQLKNYEKNVNVSSVATPYRDGNLHHADVSLSEEPAEFEYLKKAFFEYMMGRETKVWEVVYGDT
ncbi:golgin subfamily A member 4-like [Athene noctua]|uniref:golgin subfamily A member 4-like n=1 Tax=Athene noctua TaxID=126797 RepID=UPI003EBDED70